MRGWGGRIPTNHLSDFRKQAVPTATPYPLTSLYSDKHRHLREHIKGHPSGVKSVEPAAEKMLRCVSTWLQRIAFQACSFNHPDMNRTANVEERIV
jgi:hypothetical protein